MSVWLWFKHSKWIIPRWSQHNFSSFKLCLCGRLLRFILINLLPFALNIVIKVIFLRNGSFLCLERRLVTMDMQSFLFLLSVWGSQMLSLFMFPIFFNWRHIVDWDVLRCKFLSTFGWIAFQQFSQSILRSDECPGLGSSFNNVLPKQNFEN